MLDVRISIRVFYAVDFLANKVMFRITGGLSLPIGKRIHL